MVEMFSDGWTMNERVNRLIGRWWIIGWTKEWTDKCMMMDGSMKGRKNKLVD